MEVIAYGPLYVVGYGMDKCIEINNNSLNKHAVTAYICIDRKLLFTNVLTSTQAA